MDILFTALSLVAFVGCLLSLQHGSKQTALAHGHYLKAEALTLTLKGQVDRVTIVERDVEALRRELRKLSGRVYAEIQRRAEEPNEERLELELPSPIGACDNWTKALTDGPRSTASKCECPFCTAMRTQRRAEKAAILASRPLVGTVKRGE